MDPLPAQISPPTKEFSFDYSKGSGFLQDEVIYYSPNCSRPVIIPPRAITMSFENAQISFSMFRQPIWWSSSFGWMSFIPLTPSFISLPFEPLCWMPRILEVPGRSQTDRHFTMKAEECDRWLQIEKKLVDATEAIRLHFSISISPPPPPSHFGYMELHDSHSAAEQAITYSRDWFAVWMGYFSYLISQTEIRGDQNGAESVPNWYRFLLNHNFTEAWLNGISTSAVCSFGEQNPRSGIVLAWREMEADCPPLTFFISHKIPMWFLWSSREEEEILRKPYLRYLAPPEDLVKQNLKHDQRAAALGLALPSQGMIERDDVSDHLYSDWRNFFDSRKHRQQELERVQSSKDRQRCASRAKNPPITNTAMYEWKKICTSGGKEVYLRVKVTKRRNESVYHSYGEAQKRYSAFYNEWDFFSEFSGKPMVVTGYNPDSDSDDDLDDHKLTALITACNKLSTPRPESPPSPAFSSANTGPSSSQVEQREVSTRPQFIPPQFPRSSTQPRIPHAPRHSDHRIPHRHRNPRPRIPLQPPCPGTPPRFPPDRCAGVAPSGKQHDDHFPGPRTLPGSNPNVAMSVDIAPTGNQLEDYVPGPRTPPGSPPSNPNVAMSVDIAPTGNQLEDYVPGPHTPPGSPPSNPSTDMSAGVVPSGKEDEDPLHSTNMLATLQRVYGYVPTIGVSIDVGHSLLWDRIPPTLGFTSLSDEIQGQEKDGIRQFIHLLLKDHEHLPHDRDDLQDQNFMSLSMLFDFQHITRTPGGLFVFHTPVSSACDWSLGVDSASIAVFICRLIVSNPLVHTILTLSHHLLSRHIPFRTLLSIPSIPHTKCRSQDYTPVSFRVANTNFTQLDFESSMLHSKAVLRTAGGRAAMLRGGILSRIAQEFLSLDQVLSGPSVEVTLHKAGFVTPAEKQGYSYWDDDLTENEIAIIIGTYKVYTGNGEQTRTVSWFPPPSVWDHPDCGFRWLGWPEKAETVFLEIMSDIRAGKGQPINKATWRKRLRGHQNNRLITTNNEKRCQKFLERHCPLP